MLAVAAQMLYVPYASIDTGSPCYYDTGYGYYGTYGDDGDGTADDGDAGDPTLSTTPAGLSGPTPMPSVCDGPDSCVPIGGGACMGTFSYIAWVTFVASLFGGFAVAPSAVLATESSPKDQKTLAYATYLAVIDSGESASGWISSAIITHLGLTMEDFSALPTFIWIAIGSQVAVLLCVPMLKDWQKRHHVTIETGSKSHSAHAGGAGADDEEGQGGVGEYAGMPPASHS